MNEREKKELAFSKVFLLVLAFIGISVVVWLAWLHPSVRKANDRATVDSFAACTKAGNPVQESYPEVCVAKDGTRFTNPDQNIQRLVIREWQADAMITGAKDAYYTWSDASADASQTVKLSTGMLDNLLEKIDGCTSGLHPVAYERFKPGDANQATGQPWTQAELKQDAVQVGDYYYRVAPRIETMCMPADTADVRAARALHDKLSAAAFIPHK